MSPKLLIRDLAIDTAFALDALGSTFIVGGTAVVPEREELLLPLLAYLNSRAVSHLLRRVTPQFRGSFQKFEPQHLQQVPILSLLIEDDVFAGKLSDLARTVIAYSASVETKQIAIDQIDKSVSDALASSGIETTD